MLGVMVRSMRSPNDWEHLAAEYMTALEPWHESQRSSAVQFFDTLRAGK
ncbi:MAG: hypothetical protein ACJAYU_002118 [Bradymonadia bacterium]|jgi:hypothetical protein